MTTAKRMVDRIATAMYSVQAFIQTKYKRQELYLNKVDQWIHDSLQRSQAVRYCIQEHYNGVVMYGIDSFLQTASNYQYVKTFCAELRAAGVIHIGIAYSSKSGIDALIKYNASPIHTSDLTRIDNTDSESEPWVSTSGVTWTAFFDLIQYAKTHAISAGMDHRSYQGWPNKPTGTSFSSNVFNTIVRVDTPMLHDYTYGQPAYTYLRSRLMEYANQAKTIGYSANNKLSITPIFSGEQEFSKDFFRHNSPQFAMDAIVSHFIADAFPNKECIDLGNKGFLVFKYSDMLDARPLLVA